MVKKTLILIAVFIGILFCAVGFADSQFRTALGQKAPALVLPEKPGYAPATSLSDNLGSYVMLNLMPGRVGRQMNILHGYDITRAISLDC